MFIFELIKSIIQQAKLEQYQLKATLKIIIFFIFLNNEYWRVQQN